LRILVVDLDVAPLRTLRTVLVEEDENFMDLKETKYSCSRNNYNNLNYNEKHKHPHLT
jgi:hypothetical protein